MTLGHLLFYIVQVDEFPAVKDGEGIPGRRKGIPGHPLVEEPLVKAKNKEEALKLINKELSFHDFTDDCFHVDCLADKIRELKDNEVVYVYGGG